MGKFPGARNYIHRLYSCRDAGRTTREEGSCQLSQMECSSTLVRERGVGSGRKTASRGAGFLRARADWCVSRCIRAGADESRQRDCAMNPAVIIPLLTRSFYFLRHGQTDSNLRGIVAGSLDVPLTEQGMLKHVRRPACCRIVVLPKFTRASCAERAIQQIAWPSCSTCPFISCPD